jgi:hypothetical protein
VHRSQPVTNADLAPTILAFAHAKPGRKEDGMSLLPLMRDRRDFPGRGLDLETDFTPDTTEDAEDPPLSYRGVRTDRYLYDEYETGEHELYDLRNDPFELQNQFGNPVYAAVQRSLQRLLAGLADCAGRGCRRRPPLKLRFRGCTGVIAGKGKAQEATFYERGKKVGTDGKPPIRIRLRNAPGASVEALATSLDGRRVSLTRKLPGC